VRYYHRKTEAIITTENLRQMIPPNHWHEWIAILVYKNKLTGEKAMQDQLIEFKKNFDEWQLLPDDEKLYI
jgi:hypothetical protein